MAGTKLGGLKEAATNKKLYGASFYARIGADGGRNGTTGGFAADKNLAREAGRKGGLISRRRKATTPKADPVLVNDPLAAVTSEVNGDEEA